jgi:hypothetical protein
VLGNAIEEVFDLCVEHDTGREYLLKGRALQRSGCQLRDLIL